MSILGYQFPDSKVDPWESNSLLVSVRVSSSNGTWEVIDPCLTTWEAKALATWLLRATAVGTAYGPSVFSEPNVTMTAARQPLEQDRFDLTVDLELEERPPWAPITEGGPLRVRLTVDTDQLLRAAKDLMTELARFPQRGDDPTL
jgi:hypothetical protein